MKEHGLDGTPASLTPAQTQKLLQIEKELVLQEQVELSLIMPKAPIMKELWKYGAIQFGYIAFFLLSFPATAVAGVALNILHINFLYFSFTSYTQRRDSVERRSIGVWNAIFFVMSFIALVVNMSVIVFSSNSLKKLLDSVMKRKYDAYTIFTILVVIEHIGFTLKFLVAAVMGGKPAWVAKILRAQATRKQKDDEKIRRKYTLNKTMAKRQNTALPPPTKPLDGGLNLVSQSQGGISEERKRKDSVDSRFDSVFEDRPQFVELKKSEFARESMRRNELADPDDTF